MNIQAFLIVWGAFLMGIGALTAMHNDCKDYRRCKPLEWYQHGRFYMTIGVFFISMVALTVPSH